MSVQITLAATHALPIKCRVMYEVHKNRFDERTRKKERHTQSCVRWTKFNHYTPHCCVQLIYLLICFHLSLFRIQISCFLRLIRCSYWTREHTINQNKETTTTTTMKQKKKNRIFVCRDRVGTSGCCVSLLSSIALAHSLRTPPTSVLCCQNAQFQFTNQRQNILKIIRKNSNKHFPRTYTRSTAAAVIESASAFASVGRKINYVYLLFHADVKVFLAFFSFVFLIVCIF